MRRPNECAIEPSASPGEHDGLEKLPGVFSRFPSRIPNVKHFLIQTIIITATLLACSSRALAQSESKNLEFAFEAAAKYEWGESRETLSHIESRIVKALGNAHELRVIERHLVDLLESPESTRAACDFACRQLRLIGTDVSVPVLSSLLQDSQRRHMARYALSAIPGKAAEAVLIEDRVRRLLGRAALDDERARKNLLSWNDDRVDHAIASAASYADGPMMLIIVQVLGDRGAVAERDTLVRSAASDQPVSTRVAALLALAALFDWGDDFDRAASYRMAMVIAASSEDRRTVLNAIAAFDDPGLLDVVQGQMESDHIGVRAAQVVISLALAGQADDRAKAKKAIDEVIKRFPDHEELRQKAGQAMTFIERSEGFITAWVISGPFRSDQAGEEGLFNHAYGPEVAADDVDWTNVPEDGIYDPGVVNFSKIYGGDNRCAYARTVILSDSAQDVQLQIGSDDGVKVWLNGDIVHANDLPRGMTLNEDIALIHLDEGRNVLLVKVTQGGGDWQFAARLRDADGFALTGVKYEKPIE